MYLKSRLLKLEKSMKQGTNIMVMFIPTDGWTPEQLREMQEAKAQNIQVIVVEFV